MKDKRVTEFKSVSTLESQKSSERLVNMSGFVHVTVYIHTPEDLKRIETLHNYYSELPET